MSGITVTILTKNSAKYLRQVLSSTLSFPDVLLLDNGSTDATESIAKEFSNTRIVHTEFKGFGPLHNEACQLAKYDWILSLDSDEILTPELVAEIQTLSFDSACVYSFPRKNFFNGKWIRWCSWHPDRQVRLFNRTKTRFSDDFVHEKVLRDHLKEVPLRAAVIHYPYSSISDFLQKMQSYSELFANQSVGKKQASIATAITHSLWTFLKSYLLKRGFLGGYEGFLIASYQAHTAFYKYLKLRERNLRSEIEKK